MSHSAPPKTNTSLCLLLHINSGPPVFTKCLFNENWFSSLSEFLMAPVLLQVAEWGGDRWHREAEPRTKTNNMHTLEVDLDYLVVCHFDRHGLKNSLIIYYSQSFWFVYVLNITHSVCIIYSHLILQLDQNNLWYMEKTDKICINEFIEKD